MSDLPNQIVNIVGVALILYIFYYFFVQVGPLLVDSSFGRQFLSSLQTIGLIVVFAAVGYFLISVFTDIQ